MRSLGQVVAELRGDEVPEAPPVAPMSGARLLSWRGEERLEETDMSDLLGLADARYAVEVAAAGSHHLLLSGPKGAGKTSIAERIPGILPDLTRAESLELTAVHSLAGILDPGQGMVVRPPYSAPHHDASKASLIGGGSGQVRPGEVSRAHGGVLFLDEFPLFRADVIEALRQPLESGDVTIARQEESVTLPARGMVVLACNPCPCGNYSGDPGDEPTATAARPLLRDYRAKVTGPVADRVDIVRNLTPLTRADRGDRLTVPGVVGGDPGAGGRGARCVRPSGTPGRAGGSTGTLPGRSCASAGRCRRRRSAWSTTRSTTAGSADAAPPGCTDSPGRWPTCAGSTAPASPRSPWRCGCGPASRSWSACWSGRRERAPTPTGSPGSRWPGSPSRARAAARPGDGHRRGGRPRPAARGPRDRPAPRRGRARARAGGRRRAAACASSSPATTSGRRARRPAHRGAGAGARRRADRALGARTAAPRPARRVRSRSSAHARRRRTAPTSPRTSPPPSGRRAARSCPGRRSASTSRRTAAPSPSTRRPWRCSRAVPTGSIRRRTSS